MLRAVILSLILFVAFGTLVPISTEYSEASVVTSQRKYKKKKRAARYRKLAMRQKRKKQSTVKTRAVRKSAKRQVSTKKKPRKVVKRYRAKRKAVPRKRVRKRVRKTTAKKRVRRKTTAKRRVRRSVKKSRSTKRRYTAKKRTRKTSRRVARKRTAKRRVQSKKRVRRYSKKWWANYRAQQRRKKAVASRKRAIRLSAIRLAKNKKNNSTQASVRYERLNSTQSAPSAPVRTQVQMPGNPEQFQMASGEVSMDVIGSVVGETVTRGRNTAVGGVSTTTLRRTVIDQMIRESGWVENDFQKEVDGKKVYVVVAKAPDKNNRIQAKTYYFTESDGRIYRVAASSSDESTEAAQKRSEDAIRTLDRSAKPQQAQNQ